MDGLTEQQVKIFKKIHQIHLNSLGFEMRKNYELKQIKSVFWDQTEKCFKCYYKNGDWYHYTLIGTWY